MEEQKALYTTKLSLQINLNECVSQLFIGQSKREHDEDLIHFLLCICVCMCLHVDQMTTCSVSSLQTSDSDH